MVGNGHGVSDNAQVDPNTIFDLLSHQWRRIGLDHLRQTDRSVSVSTLAKRISETELGQRQSHVPPEYRERVLVSLQHIHLPKMAAADVIEWNTAKKRVAPTERAELLYPHLNLTPV